MAASTGRTPSRPSAHELGAPLERLRAVLRARRAARRALAGVARGAAPPGRRRDRGGPRRARRPGGVLVLGAAARGRAARGRARRGRDAGRASCTTSRSASTPAGADAWALQDALALDHHRRRAAGLVQPAGPGLGAAAVAPGPAARARRTRRSGNRARRAAARRRHPDRPRHGPVPAVVGARRAPARPRAPTSRTTRTRCSGSSRWRRSGPARWSSGRTSAPSRTGCAPRSTPPGCWAAPCSGSRPRTTTCRAAGRVARAGDGQRSPRTTCRPPPASWPRSRCGCATSSASSACRSSRSGSGSARSAPALLAMLEREGLLEAAGGDVAARDARRAGRLAVPGRPRGLRRRGRRPAPAQPAGDRGPVPQLAAARSRRAGPAARAWSRCSPRPVSRARTGAGRGRPRRSGRFSVCRCPRDRSKTPTTT